jgi:hypothetical protein
MGRGSVHCAGVLLMMCDVVMERATSRRSVGGSWQILSSERCEAFRAASDLVQVSQERKIKHGRGQAVFGVNADEIEMENVELRCALMTEVAGRSCWLRSRRRSCRWGRHERVRLSSTRLPFRA